ncbi:Serine/threonine-protein kinase 17B [Trachymyrmex septentrionalis]|uniref:Serine/threonine-protein kinase 17B n=2 Tax=Trachymyrmex septentrionalis TaxID=34720 RepID=A0A195FPP7_9HYME|nr:PREDICTED: probable serine/threonine-protein kinase DDB_G0278901 isoform X2 [Trachymyrmex septentrionalis]KYN42282.1 Serine/threonine-protein kinase 17B [Trachymyrmex septentrionalis]
MIYQSSHQAPTMSSMRKTSPGPQRRSLQASPAKCAKTKRNDRTINEERCRGRCRVQWSEKHVKEGLVLVQEAQLARVVKTGPITEHYEIDPKPFASGQWARVYRCRSRSTGTLYAAKYSSRSRFNADCSAELRHEIALLSLCSQSPRVVRLHDVYETPKEIILVMEYAPGGDLQTLIDGDLVPLEGDVVHFVRQLVEGLAYLHERNIAHLDIKPQNLVMMGSFPDCDVKLCDFEISRVILEGTEVREILGTPDYVAPEILHYEPITLAADMWSLGVTTYVLLTGFSPFGGETDQETFQNISLGEVDFPEELFEDISVQAKDFVAKLLVLDPSARMTAKQCLRHDWLRGAPTQASPHLRRYLSKSREVLLERVVSRENLRRAALMSQTSLCQGDVQSDQNYQQHRQQGLQDCMLSQSEMCLSHRLTGSHSSLVGSEGFASPADSQASLNSSRTSLSCASQSCLLNQEQTQGLLNKAQSRSQANLNHGLSRGILSKIRSLNRVQSQACLLNGSSAINCERAGAVATMNLVISKSREKLYGLRSLSKSQGVLDIYRSLECLKRRRKSYHYVRTKDMLPIFKQLGAEIASSRFAPSIVNAKSDIDLISDKIDQKIDQSMPIVSSTEVKTSNFCSDDRNYVESNNDSRSTKTIEPRTSKKLISGGGESEENLDSLKSVESDTLTEDSDEMPLCRNVMPANADKRPCERQHSDVSSRSNNSAASDDKEDRSTESENEEPKYTVAQLVSAFNKHQEVATKTSLRAIMSERRINEMTFPTGTKALRLFIPDINITESKIVRRKTSYKPRKNWEELRKRNEKNEGILKSLDNDSGNEDDDNEDGTHDGTKNDLAKNERDSMMESDVIDVSQALIQNEDTNLDRWSLLRPEESNEQSIFVENADTQNSLDTTIDEKYKQCVKGAMSGKMETLEKVNRNEEKMNKNEEKYPKLLEMQPRVTVSIHQKERLPNYIYSDINVAAKDDNRKTPKKTVAATNGKLGPKISKIGRTKPSFDADPANVNLKDILQRVDNSQSTSKENLENLRKRTSIAKIILNDNLIHDSQDNSLCKTNSRAKNEPLSNDNQSEEQMKLIVPPSFIRSSSLSSDSSCPTPSSVQSDVNISWEDVQVATGSSTSLEKEDVCRVTKKSDIQRTCSEGRNRQCSEDRKVWGRICTGSYTRAMEKFSGKNIDAAKKSLGSTIHMQQTEKTRRKSSPAMPQCINP